MFLLLGLSPNVSSLTLILNSVFQTNFSLITLNLSSSDHSLISREIPIIIYSLGHKTQCKEDLDWDVVFSMGGRVRKKNKKTKKNNDNDDDNGR